MDDRTDDGVSVPPKRKGKWMIGCMVAIFAVVIPAGVIALLGARRAADDYQAAVRANNAAAVNASTAGDQR